MTISLEEEQKMRQDWGMPSTRREINADVHVGAAPQKPYAQFEHLLERKQTGWRSFEQMLAAVEQAYPEGSQGRKLEQGEDGQPFRWVKGNTGNQVADASGVLLLEVFEEKVPVAGSQDGAKAATAAGVRTDFFNGWTWMKGGIKAERDAATMAAMPGANPNRKVAFEPADEASQMRHRAAVAVTASRMGLTPMPQPAEPAPDHAAHAATKPAAKPGRGE